MIVLVWPPHAFSIFISTGEQFAMGDRVYLSRRKTPRTSPPIDFDETLLCLSVYAWIVESGKGYLLFISYLIRSVSVRDIFANKMTTHARKKIICAREDFAGSDERCY